MTMLFATVHESLLAQSWHASCSDECPLLKEDRTSNLCGSKSASDPIADLTNSGHQTAWTCSPRRLRRVRAKSINARAFGTIGEGVICPTGNSLRLSVRCLSSPSAKNISLSPSGKSTLHLLPSRAHKRGASRSSRTFGCGMQWTRRCQVRIALDE